jgi:hypothetical protein
MRASRSLTVAAVAAMSVALTAGPALADDPVAVLTTGSAAGATVAVGDVLNAAVASGTTADFSTTSGGSTGVKCAQSAFSTTVVDNPAAPGVATQSTTAHTFGSCTANILGVTRVTSVTVNNLPYATTISSDGVVTVSGTDAAPIRTTIVLGTLLGTVTCGFQANGNAITGTVSNADNSISFADQAFAKTSGPVTCPSAGFFTARYAPVVDTSAAGSPVVFTN